MELLECRRLLSLTVNTFADVVNAGDPYLSLREAVTQAAANPGADTIVLPHMIGSVEGSYVLSLGEITIDDAGPLTIDSDGGAATIDAQGGSRVFWVVVGSVVDLEGLVVTGGHAVNGGGIFNQGSVTISNSMILDNSADYSGGGFYNGNRGSVTISGSVISGNSVEWSGGGVYNDFESLVAISDSAIFDNSAYLAGGAVYNYGGDTTIIDSTLSSNTAGASGGGVFHVYGALTVSGSTFSNNSAGSGIIYNSEGNYATITDNIFHANSASDAVLCDGGYFTTITGNIITGNTGAGVAVAWPGSANSIQDNVINSNTGLAIDLGGDGRTANDPGDVDNGVNNLQNYPIITGFDVGAATHVTGRLNSTPDTTFTIDLYADSAAAPRNPGESTRYLGAVQTTTDAQGDASFDVVLDAATAAGEIVTATATDPDGNTSEFSDLNYVSVTPTTGLYTSESGAVTSFSIVLTSRPTAKVTVPLRSSDATEGSISRSSLVFTPANWNVPQVVTVTGKDDSIADGAVVSTVVTGAAFSSDPIFNGMDGDDVSITNFDNDFAPPTAVKPTGGLIYDASLEGVLASEGDAVSYAIQVDPGQTVTVVVESEGTDLRARVQLFRKGHLSVLAAATAAAAGRDAVIQTFATPGRFGADGSGTGTYFIRVSGANRTTGLYHIRVILNAAVEEEGHDGDVNDARAGAQSLEPSFLPHDGLADAYPWGSAAGRGAVLGRTDEATPDYYALSLSKGATVTAALTGLSDGGLSLALETSAGTTVAAGWSDGAGPGRRIVNFVATKTGTYYVRITGDHPDGTDYSLVVTRNAELETGSNHSIATAQDVLSPEVSGKRWALGAVTPSVGLVASAQSYAFEDISATGHAILQGSDYEWVFLDPAALDGFQFAFLGATSDSIYVITDGYLHLPASFGSISAMNRDLVISGAADAAVYWQVFGTGDQQRLVVQWNDVGFSGYPDADSITFQVVLSEADGSIQFNYKDLQTDVPYFNEGLYASVGIGGYDSSGNYSYLLLDTNDVPNQFVGTGRSTRIAAPLDSDYYRVNADAGSTLKIETTTPASQSGGFVNDLDPIVRLYDSAGNLVASDDNGASDGRNAKLSYKVPKGKGGAYTIQVDSSPTTTSPIFGDYILSVQNATGALPPFQVAGTDVPDGGLYNFLPSSIQVDFNDGVLLTSLQASDLKIDGISATGFTVMDGNTVQFDLPGDLLEGVHTVTIAAGAIRDLQGTDLAAFTEHFTLDQTPPRVIVSSIQEGDVLAPGDLTYTVTFSEPMSTSSFGFSLVGQSQGYRDDVNVSFGAGDTTFTIQYAGLPEDNYTLTLYGYGFEDPAGNSLDGEPAAWPIPPNVSGDGVEAGDFDVSFFVDASTTTPFPTPLTSEHPSGSLVYGGSLSGLVNFAGDADGFAIALDAGQALTVVAAGQGGLQPTVEVRDHTGALVGSTVATGEEAVLQTVAIAADDVYTIIAGGAAGTSGKYALRVILNAAAEIESHSGPANNSVADAQDIDGSFTDLIKGATRGAVLGTLGGTDVYSFPLQAGQALAADLAFATPPQVFGPRTDYDEYNPAAVALGDVNNDDKLDMVANSEYGSYLTVRLGNGDGTFGDSNAFGFESDSPWQIAMDDLNGDGNLDVVSSNLLGDYSGNGGVTVMLGHGDGTFDPAVGYFGGFYNIGLALGDVNGDDKPDIVTTSLSGFDNTVRVLINIGDGTFGTPIVYTVGGDPNRVAVGDFDGDGALDIVTSNGSASSGETVTVLLNNGDGTFGAGIGYIAGTFGYAVAVGNLNGDNALDIVVTNHDNNAVAVLLNNGDGTFTDGVPYTVSGHYYVAVALGDVNGDGSLDIVAGAIANNSFSGGLVSILLNDGSGHFGPEQAIDAPRNTVSVALGDLDGDGRLDLATANSSSNTLSVFLNQSAPTTLELIGPDGVTVLAATTADDVHAAFSNFIAAETGTYYLRVSGPPSGRAYNLVVTRDAVIDLGGNDTTATAQPLGPVHVALGAVGAADDPADVYSFTAAAGESVHLFTTTPGDRPGEFANTLNPHIRVFNTLGVLVAEGSTLADGRNEDVVLTAGAAGTYFVEVSAEDGTSGEYILDPSPAAAAAPISTALAPALGRPLTASVRPSGRDADALIAPAPAPVPIGTSPRGSAASLPGQGAASVNRIAASAAVSGPIFAPKVWVGPRRHHFDSVLAAFSRGPKPRHLLGKIGGGEERPTGLFESVIGGDAIPSVGKGSEAEEVRPDETTLALAWDACLDDEVWSASITDPGEPALIAAAGVAAIGLHAYRRRDAKHALPSLDPARSFQPREA